MIRTRFLLTHAKRAVSTNAFRPGDNALVRQINRPDNIWLIDSLDESKTLGTQKGNVNHAEIIGSDPRTVIHSQLSKSKAQKVQAAQAAAQDVANAGTETSAKEQKIRKPTSFVITHPTLEEYVRLTKRDAQPIYALDAAIIATLADIHVDYPAIKPVTNEPATNTTTTNSPTDTPDAASTASTASPSSPATQAIATKYQLEEPPVQLLEAGAGHGSLTLTLSKLLHPANAYAKLFQDKELRGGILHSLDCNLNHLNRAKKNVKGFRRGIYYDDVEFHHVEGPMQWLDSEAAKWAKWEESKIADKVASSGVSLEVDSKEGEETDVAEGEKEKQVKKHQPFLSGCFLDMPDPVDHIAAISKHLKPDAPLVVFQPSITQFLDILNLINGSKGEIKLSFIKAVELMPGIGAGMREWDLRTSLIKKKAASSTTATASTISPDSVSDDSTTAAETAAAAESTADSASSGEERVGIVCRPKVAVKTMGGGFLAIFKKVPEKSVLRDKSEFVKLLV